MCFFFTGYSFLISHAATRTETPEHRWQSSFAEDGKGITGLLTADFQLCKAAAKPAID
jgi:hypothetical protein